MSIRAQILCSLGVLFLLSCGMSVATWTVTSVQKTDGLVVNLAGRQRMQIQRIAKDALAYAHLAKGAASAPLAEDVRRRLAAFETVQTLLARGGDSNIAGKTLRIPPPSRETAGLLEEAARLARPFGTEVEAVLAKGDGATADRLVAASEAVVAAQEKAVSRLQEESEAAVGVLMAIQAGGMALGVVVFVAVLFLLGRTLRQPLFRLRAYAEAVAGGDLKAEAAGDYPPELADLRDALARMVAALEANMAEAREKGRESDRHAAETGQALAVAREQEARTAELLARMGEAAGKALAVSESVMNESSSLHAQTQQVALGAGLQRDRMIETATAMEEMNATVLEVARNAASAAASASGAKDKAITGAAGVRSAVDSIESIRRRILELKESMTRLGQQADSIGHIMNVISDIADQTNLLALNAAIEAGLEPLGEFPDPVDGPGHLFCGGQSLPGAFPGGLGAFRGPGRIAGHGLHRGVHFLHGRGRLRGAFVLAVRAPAHLRHPVRQGVAGPGHDVGQILQAVGGLGHAFQPGPLGPAHGCLGGLPALLRFLGPGLGGRFLGLDLAEGSLQGGRHFGHGRENAALALAVVAGGAHVVEAAGRHFPGQGGHDLGLGPELPQDAPRHEPGRRRAQGQGQGEQQILEGEVRSQGRRHGGYLGVGLLEPAFLERGDAGVEGFGAGVEVAHQRIARRATVCGVGPGHACARRVHGLEIPGDGLDLGFEGRLTQAGGQSPEFVQALPEGRGRLFRFGESVVLARGGNVGQPLLHVDGRKLHARRRIGQGQALGAHDRDPLLYGVDGKGHDQGAGRHGCKHQPEAEAHSCRNRELHGNRLCG